MSRFYWRLFLAFIAVLVITTVLSALVGVLWIRSDVDNTRHEALRGSLTALAEQAQRALSSDGEEGLRSWIQMQQRELPAPLLVIGPNGQDLLGRPVPPGLKLLRAGRGLETESKSGRRFARRWPQRRLHDSAGRAYLLLLPLRHGPWANSWQRSPLRLLYPALLLLVGALACIVLARYLVRPLRALRAAGQAITAGDLSARVGTQMTERKDEFGALAKDFNRMAERVEQLVGNQQRLLRDVSHELRSPLARLRLAVGLQRQRAVDVDQSNIDRIEREVEKLDRLIGQIMDLSRLDSGQAPAGELVDLQQILKKIVADASFEGSACGIEVQLCDVGALCLRGDPALLSSALENLVRNALQHARSAVEVAYTEQDGVVARVTIRDDGPGVSPDFLTRMFEPFESGPGGASGIGLAIAARAVRLHGGRIWANNESGGGLLLCVELPGLVRESADSG